MTAYSPLKITGSTTGLVQSREEFLLPDDAYPILLNAYIFRERILRKEGTELLGRLQRNIGTTDGSGNATITIGPLPIQVGVASFSIGTDFFVDPGTSSPVTLLTNSTGSAVLNRSTGVLTVTGSQITTAIEYIPGLPVMGIRTFEQANSTIDETIVFDQNYAYIFDSGTGQYQDIMQGQPGAPATWNAHAADPTGTDFFWSTNYFISGQSQSPFTTNGVKLFWVTNNTGQFGNLSDPPRITDGTKWVNWWSFSPLFTPQPWIQIDAGPNYIVNWLSMLPFRGRMVLFNTWEGSTPGNATNFSNRIRWSTIGNPFIAYTNGPPAAGSWRDDIRGQGGFLDIPTSEDIISVGFVRDNLVVYCERSTWQLRFTGRAIAPFQIERVNSEIGAEGPFSAIQFDTSLVAIGDKGIIECDSYKADRIDIKIPDFVYQINLETNGNFRVHGIRDFLKRLAYWTIPPASTNPAGGIFPANRLVYNYENDSWALFTDSLTAMGNYQPQSDRTWLNTDKPWIECNFTWIDQPISTPAIIAGNQQGYVSYISKDDVTTNDVSLFISNITANTSTPTVITSPNHNLQNFGFNDPWQPGYVISISGIPVGSPFASSLNNPQVGLITAATNANPCQITSAVHNLSTGNQIIISGVGGMTQLNGNTYTITVVDANNFTLNGINSTAFGAYTSGGEWTGLSNNVFGVVVVDANTFELWKYNPLNDQFSIAQLDIPSTSYQGGGQITVLDNFSIKSKKFNFLDEGQSIQIGYIDILMDASENSIPGAISMNMYLDYDDQTVSNLPPQNVINSGTYPEIPDNFFNSIIPTTPSTQTQIGGTKFWQRVFCPSRANFLTIQYTFSNSQMVSLDQETDVQIDAQVIWLRKGGRMTQSF